LVDKGKTWKSLNFNKIARVLLVSVKNGETLYAAGWDNISSNDKISLFKTKNSGLQWSYYPVNSVIGKVYALAVDPINEDIIYMGGI